jgi:RNA polymerase sigma factor (TIGR02999 family)
MSEVTRILSAIQEGDPHAADQLLPLVYNELRKLAAAKLSQEKPGQTLEATALVHEAYVRLVGKTKAQDWDSRGHFFAAAAEAMRRILVENARRKRRVKHGGKFCRVEVAQDPALQANDNLLALDEALVGLAAEDPIAAKIVELRHFAGLGHEAVLGGPSNVGPHGQGTSVVLNSATDSTARREKKIGKYRPFAQGSNKSR